MSFIVMKGETIYSFPGASDLSRGAPFHLQMTGISRCDGSYRIARRPSESFFVFEHVMEGHGFLEIGGGHFEPCAGDVYFIDGRLAHSYWSSSDDPWTKIWFNVEGPLVASLIDLYGFAGSYLFKNCPLEHIFRLGFETARDNPSRAQEQAALCVHEIAQELARRVKSEQPSRSSLPEGIVNVKAKLDRELFRTPPLKELCRISGLSASQTLRLFKAAYGATPIQYSLDRRIASAKLMLSGSAKSVKEIARDLGFADEYYFSNMFKARSGSSPSAYRKLSR